MPMPDLILPLYIRSHKEIFPEYSQIEWFDPKLNEYVSSHWNCEKPDG